MRHCSVQVRGLLTREELDRYEALIEVGQFLERLREYDRAGVIQREIDRLIQPAIERLKAKGRLRDVRTQEYLEMKQQQEENTEQRSDACTERGT